jgi:tetratricopeptide (TPR) repeat protein
MSASPPVPASPEHGPVLAALARLEASRAFHAARRHRVLLRHLVTRLLQGDLGSLKESLIAVEVFGRSAAGFDPVQDSIVRVEARRLRARLAAYHAGEGRDAPLRIELPVGSYVPQLVDVPLLPPAAEATRRARDLIERGEHYLRQPLSQPTLEAALERFDAALREAPHSPAAFVGLGRAWLNLGTGWYREPSVAGTHAAEALQRAIALDAQQPLAHALLGAWQHQFRRDWPAALSRFRRALALAPEAAFVHAALGSHLTMRGELGAAEAALAQARRLDPQYINSRVHMVNLRIAQGRQADAEAEAAAVRDLAPDTLAAHGLGALLAVMRGDAPSAVAHYRQACVLMPQHAACQAHLAGALALAGRAEEAQQARQELQQRLAGRSLSPYVMAIVELRFGQADEALRLLQRAADDFDPNVVMAAADPSLAALRADARFLRLCAALRSRPVGRVAGRASG